MSNSLLAQVVRRLRWRTDAPVAHQSDGELLARFADFQDEVAFETLLQRHGPLVLRVCRGLLADLADADDAFQATFLVLVRRAGTLDRRSYLGGWLYEVAHRTALKVRSGAAERRSRENRLAAMTMRTDYPPPEIEALDRAAVLRQELSRLPEKYRAPLLLCYLQGKTNDEAAACLGWTRGTVAGRLSRARDLLRVRLTRRGLTLVASLEAALCAAVSNAAPVSARLADLTLRLASDARSTPAAISTCSTAGTAAAAVLSEMRPHRFRAIALFLLATILSSGAGTLLVFHSPSGPTSTTPPGAGELPTVALDRTNWPMFGGTPARNMVNPLAHDLPTDWTIAPAQRRNVRWAVPVGTRSCGSPVVAGGRVFVGTNNERPRQPHILGDRGILMSFRAADGRFQWQAAHAKLAEGQAQDWPLQGLCSSPAVEGDRLYYVSNRCELVCAEVAGDLDRQTAKIVWTLDLRGDLGVQPHNMTASSPLVVGDLVFAVTGNGVDQWHRRVPAPEAPSFIAVNKQTGKVVWMDSSPGQKIMHGQWSNPTYAHVAGQAMVVFPGGDGWLYAFEPETGTLLWKFDCNPKAAVWQVGGRGERCHFLATPVVHNERLYIGVGDDPEHFEGIGHLWCIELARAVVRGRINKDHDVSPVNDNFDSAAAVNQHSALAWHYGGRCTPADQARLSRDYYFGRTLSTCAVHDGLVYAAELAGYLHCLDAQTGKLHWTQDLKAPVWGSPLWADGKLYLGTEDGDMWVLAHGPTKKLLTKIEMEEPIRSTPAVAGRVIYVLTEQHLYAIATNK